MPHFTHLGMEEWRQSGSSRLASKLSAQTWQAGRVGESKVADTPPAPHIHSSGEPVKHMPAQRLGEGRAEDQEEAVLLDDDNKVPSSRRKNRAAF